MFQKNEVLSGTGNHELHSRIGAFVEERGNNLSIYAGSAIATVKEGLEKSTGIENLSIGALTAIPAYFVGKWAERRDWPTVMTIILLTVGAISVGASNIQYPWGETLKYAAGGFGAGFTIGMFREFLSTDQRGDSNLPPST